MKVLYFHQHFSTPEGASGIRSYEMARRLIDHGHKVTMICGSYDGGKTGLDCPFVRGRREGVVDGIYVIEFNLAYSNYDNLFKRSLVFIKYALHSIGIAMTEKYDVLFATSTPLTAGIPGIFARWLRRKPFVFEVRDLWPELPREMGVIKNPVVLHLMSMLEWLSYHSANHCIGLSQGMVDGIARRGVDPAHIILVSNGCDLEIFGGMVKPWRPDGIEKNDLMAVFTGTHGIANGLDAVLDAGLELKKRGCNTIKLLLIGQGKLKSALQQRAERECLDNVIFHDPVNKEKLAGLLAGADIGLQVLANIPAFYFGTSPNKFFDYIASELPVLNNYPGWLAEMINNNDCGYTIDADDSVAFADALEKASMDREKLKEMGRNARALAECEFDRQELADRFVNCLESVCND